MNLNEPIGYDNPDDERTFVQQAANTKPTFLGWLFVVCLAVIMIMGTIKVGLIWFT